jgi:hypothetical protein
MDEKLGKFIDNFADLVQLAQARSHRRQAGVQLLDTLTGHLGLAAEDLAVVEEQIPPHRFVDADIVMAGLAALDPESRLVGIGGGGQRHHQSLSDMLQQSQAFPQFPLAQPDYVNLAVGPRGWHRGAPGVPEAARPAPQAGRPAVRPARDRQDAHRSVSARAERGHHCNPPQRRFPCPDFGGGADGTCVAALDGGAGGL